MTVSFWIILFATALYGVLHSLLAANRVKALAARWFGSAGYRRGYRFFFSVVGAISFLPVLLLVARLPDRTLYTIPAPWVFLTVAVQGLALLGLLWGVMHTGALRFVGLEQLFEKPKADSLPERLVVSGLYRWVRHPLYTFSFLLLWLTPVMTVNVLALNLGLSAYMLIGTIFEENKLVEQFGPAYLEYRKRTPRIIPGLILPRK